MKYPLLLLALLFYQLSYSQTGPGIGFYPTGTEAGLGFRSGRDSKLMLDVRTARMNLLGNPNKGSWVAESSLLYRLVHLEKLRFHMGLGARADFAHLSGEKSKFGCVMPIGVEAFPFPFQNAGLFFEVAPFYTVDNQGVWNAGLRTSSGFVFYFPKKKKNEKL